MRLKGDATCYACDAAAIGVEHVPPKGFVPINKRNGVFDHVPACRVHNQARSLDDQYTATKMALVTPSAYEDAASLRKLQRTLERKNGALRKKVRASMCLEDGQLAITHDTARTGRVFGDIARALYFLETGTKAPFEPPSVSAQGAYTGPPGRKPGPRTTHPDFLRPLLYAFHETEAFPVRGRNLSVLWYQVAPQGAVRFWLNESVEVLAFWPTCDFPGLFRTAGAWLFANGKPSVYARAFCAFGEEADIASE